MMKVLAINSLPANGNAGMKMVMHVLGTKVIPVPSLLLTGIGSISGFEKFPVNFEQLLAGTLALARKREEELIVYVGYLGNAEQIQIIKKYLTQYKDIVKFLLVDPVCGDHGRAYVPQEIIANWGDLVKEADLCLPNITEVALLSGNFQDFDSSKADNYIKDFRQRYTKPALLVTSLETDKQEVLINRLYDKKAIFESQHTKEDRNYGGSGDAFAAYLIDAHFYKNHPLQTAVKTAGEAVKAAINQSIKIGSNDLMLG